jgi:hypothetical protein
LKDALDNGLIKPKHVVLLMYIFNCGGDGFYDYLLYNHPRMLKYRLSEISVSFDDVHVDMVISRL